MFVAIGVALSDDSPRIVVQTSMDEPSWRFWTGKAVSQSALLVEAGRRT